MVSARQVNLAFFANHELGSLNDLAEAAQRISRLHPGVHAVALTSKARVRRLARLVPLALRPTLTIEFDPIRFPEPMRGRRLRRHRRGGRRHGRSGQGRRG